MPRKNAVEWTTIGIKKAILKQLDLLKVHPNQSYSELIETILKSKKVKNATTNK